MKRIFGTPRALAALLALSLLAGCGAQSGAGAATAETAAPAPTAAPQQLTVYYAGGADSPAATALRTYAAAQGVTLQELYPGEDPAAADLAVLEAEPADDGSWKDLTADALLATAAARAGLDAETPVYALPLGKTLYAYWADGDVLAALLGGEREAVTADLQAASWDEWSALAETVTEWLAEPAETALTLNGRDYTLPAERPEAAAGLTGVFSLCEDSVTGGGGLPLYTGALLAAGQARDADTLTGPLNGVYSALTLELENAAWADSTAAAMQAVQGRTALFCRGSLADWLLYSGGAAAETLCWLPVKCDLVESDLGETEYNLTGLLNYPVLTGEAWLAVPAGADEARTEAAAAAMLWLYTSQAGEETLTQTLGLVTPWGTASNDTPLTAMQVEQVGAGILPEPALDTAAAAGLGEAARALARDEDGALRTRFTASHRSAWREAAIAALQPPEAPETTQE